MSLNPLNLQAVKEEMYRIYGKNFESFRKVMNWERLADALTADQGKLTIEIFALSDEAAKAETYQEYLEKRDGLKSLRERWDKVAGNKTIGFSFPEVKP